MADEPETPETPEPETPPAAEEPVAPTPPARKARAKPPARDGGSLADADVKRIAAQLKDDLLEGFREAGAFDPPLEPVAAPTQPEAPPPPSEVAPADGPAPEPPRRQSAAARFLGTA